jgi:hypothetical protein
MPRFPFFQSVVVVACLVLPVMLFVPGVCHGSHAKGHTVYVPVYSMVYTGDRAVPVNLASTLSIRNTDPNKSIRVVSVDYYSSSGKLIKKMFSAPLQLAPLASTSIFIKEKDTTGGFSTSFIVRWDGQKDVSSPIIECVNIGAYSGLGISFITLGREIR